MFTERISLVLNFFGLLIFIDLRIGLKLEVDKNKGEDIIISSWWLMVRAAAGFKFDTIPKNTPRIAILTKIA